MAKAATKTAVAKTAKKDVAVSSGFGSYAGGGMEGTTADSFAIPFLAVLQKGSPQVDEASPKYIDGAKAGEIFETVSMKRTPGKEGVVIVFCGYKRVFLRWGARGTPGAGFKGEFTPEAAAQLRVDEKVVDLDGRTYFKDEQGNINPLKSDRLSDTRNHFVLIVNEKAGTGTPALLSLTSTQIKKSKHVMSVFSDIKIPDSGATAPTFMHMVRMTTVPESNDKGNWYGVQFDLEGQFESPDDKLFLAAAAFKDQMVKGGVKVDYNNLDGEEAGETAKKGF